MGRHRELVAQAKFPSYTFNLRSVKTQDADRFRVERVDPRTGLVIDSERFKGPSAALKAFYELCQGEAATLP